MFLDMLSGHPESLVAAIGDDGILVPMPAHVPLSRHRVAVGRSLLDIVVAGDKVEVITSWERSLTEGSASMIVHLLSDPDRPVLVMIVDAVARFGAHLALISPGDASGVRVTPDSFAGVALPRSARVRKNASAIITDVDAATTQILGWQPEQLVGRRSLEFIHADDAVSISEPGAFAPGSTSMHLSG